MNLLLSFLWRQKSKGKKQNQLRKIYLFVYILH